MINASKFQVMIGISQMNNSPAVYRGWRTYRYKPSVTSLGGVVSSGRNACRRPKNEVIPVWRKPINKATTANNWIAIVRISHGKGMI